ncbi:hypothetical protein M1446_03640 [Candidatus Dependentiae bacterium]|nr:hypothetical protein [Candidatus Dependentiae bacterium]
MNKFLLFSILLPVSLFCMEPVPMGKNEVESSPRQMIPGLINDVSRIIITAQPKKLGEKALIPEINEQTEAVRNILNNRSILLTTSKSFLSQKDFLDKIAIDQLKQFDTRILNTFLLKLHDVKKDINGKLILADLLIKSGADPKTLFTEKNIKQDVIEAVQKNNTLWLEFLFKNRLNPNFSSSGERYALSRALKMVKTHPQESLKVVKLLLEKGANPLMKVTYRSLEDRVMIIDSHSVDTIYNLFAPKRIKKITKNGVQKEYSSPEAKEIKKLLRKVVYNIDKYKQVGLID